MVNAGVIEEYKISNIKYYRITSKTKSVTKMNSDLINAIIRGVTEGTLNHFDKS